MINCICYENFMFQNRTNNGNLFAVARQKTVGIQDGITERRCCHDAVVMNVTFKNKKAIFSGLHFFREITVLNKYI